MTRTTLLATLALAACADAAPAVDVSAEALATRGDTVIRTEQGPVHVVTFEGQRGLPDRDSVVIDREQPAAQDGGGEAWQGTPEQDDTTSAEQEQPGAQDGTGPTPADRYFDPEGLCPAPHPDDARACPEIPQDLLAQDELLAEIVGACNAWMDHGPAGYAMVEDERWTDDAGAITGKTFDAVICNGGTWEAFNRDTGVRVPADSVPSIDNLFAMLVEVAMDPEFQVNAVFHRDLGYPMAVSFETDLDGEHYYFAHFVEIAPIGAEGQPLPR